MHRRALLMSAAGAAMGACSSSSQPSEPPQAAEAPPIAAPPPASVEEAGFDVALYRSVATESGNHFISPYSVETAFALVYPGAGGATATEIASTFGFDASVPAQLRQTRATAEALQRETGGSEFTVANAAWVERSMNLRPEYQTAIRDELGGVIEPVDFIGNQRAALRQINAWAARETRNRITEILSNEDPMRRLVLTNAVYFKGKWRDPFTMRDTRDGVFYTGAQSNVPARLMRHRTHARYIETPTFQGGEFEYDGGAFALAVFLPRERTGLPAFESALTGASLDALMGQLASAQRVQLDLTLPKVEMRTDYQLGPTLQAMGVRTAFTSSADFTAIAADADLMISAVIHKAFLAIDEEGTEAAAVTAVDMMTTSAPIGPPPPPPIEFKADRPFFLVLHHKPTRTRLFLGRITTTA